ncbi:hypothetical protein [Micromonospora sp. MA102]|uniref:hypothetical protein n=1 Tax=Micromonospora sp. MA102 TaxID=2952755 RepID=UPI0021CA9AE7|nr:hypothetical protein [Micromonospora sp. MA102]
MLTVDEGALASVGAELLAPLELDGNVEQCIDAAPLLRPEHALRHGRPLLLKAPKQQPCVPVGAAGHREVPHVDQSGQPSVAKSQAEPWGCPVAQYRRDGLEHATDSIPV